MDNNIIGQRINSALASQDKKQKQLAAALGVTDNTISYFCSGKRTPNIRQLIDIARFFNTSVDWLLGLRNSQSCVPQESDIAEYTGLSDAVVRLLHEEKKHISDDKTPFAEFINFAVSGDTINTIFSEQHFSPIAPQTNLELSEEIQYFLRTAALADAWSQETDEKIYFEFLQDYMGKESYDFLSKFLNLSGAAIIHGRELRKTYISNAMENLKTIVDRYVSYDGLRANEVMQKIKREVDANAIGEKTDD